MTSLQKNSDLRRQDWLTRIVFLPLVVVVTLFSAASVKAQVVVNFPDPNLEAVIRMAIGKPTGDIYDTDLLGLMWLDAWSQDIVDLSGLQHCVDLIVVDLCDNQISDISPLSGLTQLTVLWLDFNQISDISPLSGLTQLAWLSLWDNQISDISSLSGLTQLEMLDLYDNQISNISPLSGLTQLIGLSLGNNQISDISPLSGLTQLIGLDLGNNQISDISPLSGLTQLIVLYLDYNQISDISPLVANPGIDSGDYVNLIANPLSQDALYNDMLTLNARGVSVAYDSDSDGLLDMVETNTGIFVDETDTGTDPNNPDTDGDGVNDGDEVFWGTNPNDVNDTPQLPTMIWPGFVLLAGTVTLTGAFVLRRKQHTR